MKKNKFKWLTKEEFLRLGKKLFSWLPFFVACGFTLFAAVFFIVPTEDAEAVEAASDVTDWVGNLPSNGAQLSSSNGQFKVKYIFDVPCNITIYERIYNQNFELVRSGRSTTSKTIIGSNTFNFDLVVNDTGYVVHLTDALHYFAGSYDYYTDASHNSLQKSSASNGIWANDGNNCYIFNNSHEALYDEGTGTFYAPYDATVTYAFFDLRQCNTITGGDDTSKAALDYFCWSDKDTTIYEAGDDNTVDVQFWSLVKYAPTLPEGNLSDGVRGAKLFIKPEYTLNGATITFTRDGTKHMCTCGSQSYSSSFGIWQNDYSIVFIPLFTCDPGTSITISGVTQRQTYNIPCYVDTSTDDTPPYFPGITYGESATTKKLTQIEDFKDAIVCSTTPNATTNPDSGIIFNYHTETLVYLTIKNTDLYSLPVDQSPFSFRTTGFHGGFPGSYVPSGDEVDSDYLQLNVANNTTTQASVNGQLKYTTQGEGFDKSYTFSITRIALVVKINFNFHNLNISSQDNIKSIKYNQFKINDSGSWAQTGDPTSSTDVDNMLPNKHAFEFDINFADDCQYNLENLGYLYTHPYTYGISGKIKDVLSITDNDDNDITYNFTFYADRLRIYIPGDIITSDITVTIKQGPEKFVDCLNSFDFENEDIKNNVSVYGMEMIQSSLGNDTVMAVTGDKIDYEIVKNSRTYYYAVKLLVNDSQEGYNYTFDNFWVESSRGARIKILNGEELDKIGLKDDDHIRYISVYLADPNATDHRISFTGIYATLKTIEIKLSDNSIEEMKADSFIGAIEPQFSSENKKWTMKLYHGQYLNFTVVPKEGYYLNRSDILTISSQGGSYEVQLNELGSNMGVFVHNVKCDLKLEVNAQQAPLSITFEDIEGFKYYSVNESNGNINSIGDQIFDIVTVDPDSDYYFAVKADNGYDLSTVSLKNHDTDLSNISIDEQYKYYKIEKIQQYTKISGTVEKIKYKIIFNSSSSDAAPGSDESKAVITYTQDDEQISSLNIVHGESISFEVGLEDRFSNSKIKVYSKWDDGSAEEIFAFDGIYTLSNIMHNCEVYVEGVELNQYIINFVENDKVQYELDGKLKSSDAISVKHGDNYNFKLIPKKGYQITDKTIVNHRTVEGTTSLKPTSAGNYTISNMLQDCTIIVENAEDIIYKISFKNQGGVTYRNRDGDVITESLSIKYGENFEFAVELDDAYDDSIQGMKPIANDDKSINSRVNKLAEGKYLISNVIEDINLEVLNVRKNRYTVNLIKMEGVDFHNGSGKVITGPNEVEHGESLNFKVYVYPAYDGSKLKVMLGDNPLAAQTAGDYLVEGVTENKTVTVIGVEESLVTRLINTINNLPNPISDLDDVDKVIEASKMYQLIPADQRHLVTNISVLNSLQDQSKDFHHVNNGITVEGISWRIKLVAVPISSSTEACSRIYKKLDSEYILSLYDVYFWDTVNEVRYKPAKEQTITLTLPKPDLKYFENATGVCGDAKGDVDFLSLTFSGNSVHININSPGYIGVIADRTSTPGRSSLLDAADANWETLTNALSSFGIGSSKEDKSQGTSIFNDIENDSDSNDIIQEETGNISEKYKSRNNKVTAQGSAIRLVLVLMIIILIAVIVWVIVKKRKERKAMDN